MLLLLLGDALLLTGALLVLTGRGPERLTGWWARPGPEIWLLLSLAGGGLLLWAHRTADTLKRPEILALLVSGGLLLAFGLAFPVLPLASPSPVLALLLLTAAVACAWHGVAEKVFFPAERVLLVGRDPLLAEISRLLAREAGSFEVLAREPGLARLEADPGGCRPCSRADLVVYGQDVTPGSEALVRLRLQGMPVWDAATFFQHLTGRVPLSGLDAAWLLQQAHRRRPAGRLGAAAKRLLDLGLALLLLPVALPVLAVCALAIKLDSKGPVFFVQERLGQGGVPFRLYKLRTMVVEAEEAGPQWCRDHDPRITRVGRVLRRLRLDELPQIFNVLRNDMSFVGPRPIRAYFTELLAREIPCYRLRLLAKPGLSGWAQVHSGHANTVAAHALMLQYDLFYLLHRSLLLDLLVLLKTVKVLLAGQGR
jgi:lipopolysaccharide/colanic/teichoic acid biosynthesis glycosyltransferase